MIRAVYPGSFDPVTFGHIDVIKRASRLVDELVVGVLHNKAKIPLFSVEERVKMLNEVFENLANVKVIPFEGLLVDFVKSVEAQMVIRGLRAITDFEYELQMAQGNQQFYKEVETMFLATSAKYSYISSSMVKEIAHFGGDVEGFVPDYVKERVKEKYHIS